MHALKKISMETAPIDTFRQYCCDLGANKISSKGCMHLSKAQWPQLK